MDYLYENSPGDLLKLQPYLPIELFEGVKIVTDHFFVDTWNDYSSGGRKPKTERTYSDESRSDFESVNQENFENFMKINKDILKSNMNTTYEEYTAHLKRFHTYKKEKDDCYETIKNITTYYYKLIK